jgi:hypothetical protein
LHGPEVLQGADLHDRVLERHQQVLLSQQPDLWQHVLPERRHL